MRKSLLLLMLLLLALPMRSQTAIGRWRDCLDYSLVTHVAVTPDRAYAAAKGGLFYYDLEDNTLNTLSKSTGLHDVGIADMAYDPQSGYLVVGYENANVDLIYKDRVYNISDIKRSDILGDKNIYHIRFHDGKAYLATGFGIVVVDLSRHEIKETYFLGTDGGYLQVYDIAFVGDSIYAATHDGLRRAAAAEPYLGISDRWVPDTRLHGTKLTVLAEYSGQLFLAGYTYDPDRYTVFRLADTGYVAVLEGTVRTSGLTPSLHVGGGHLAITLSGCVSLFEGQEYCEYVWGELAANDAVLDDEGRLWVGHSWGGMVLVTSDGDRAFQPSGPASGDNVFQLVPTAKGMMLCPGGHTTTYANTYLESNVFTTDGRNWKGLDRGDFFRNTYDAVDAAVNPTNPDEVAVALWGSGVAITHGGVVDTLFNETNTNGALQPYIIGNYSTLLTSAVEYDRSGNLWVLNSHQPYALARLDRSGNWSHFSTAAMAAVPEVDKLVCDSVTGYKWYCGRSNVIYVHDGEGRMAKVNPNRGSRLNTESVNAIVQDRDGHIWIGTNKGIKVIYDAYRVFQNGGRGEEAPVNCSNIVITNGEFFEYLMAYENITSIAVDGANRKWVGTASGGLYLLSANGMEQLLNFTTANSPIFSDKIVTIGIQPTSGEVYVGTDKGLQVYRHTATYADAEPQSEVYAFPNPVRPGYEGPIAIKGFTRDALVRITDAGGHTVFSTQAYGGQAVWNGRTASGQLVASGVYYVFASDANGENRSVAKILIVR